MHTQDHDEVARRCGAHRVLEPRGSLPQAALRLSSAGLAPLGSGEALHPAAEDELHIAVDRLNIDSASFRQIEEEVAAAGEDPDAGLSRRVLAIVADRGKMHNPVTGSGGMLLGRVARVGSRLAGLHAEMQVGEPIATLVSLTLTPLRIDEIIAVDRARHQLVVRGAAALFQSGAFARLPPADVLPETVALSALDVAGAAPQVERLVRAIPGPVSVLILGCGGKSGLLCAAAARRAGATKIIGVEVPAAVAARAAAERLGAFDAIVSADAADALAVARAAITAGGGEFALTVSCVNGAGAELGAILATRDRGVVYFFSMATSFTRAALGAEGVGKDIDMLVGNGYCHGHADGTLRLLAEDPRLRALFIERYG